MSRRRSLQRRYAALFAVLVGGAVLGSGLIELFGAYDDNQIAVARIEQGQASRAAAQIDQFFRELDADLASAAPAFWAAGGGTLDQRLTEYQRVLRQSPAFTGIVYVNADGRERLHVSRVDLNLLGRNIDHAQDPVFLAARAQPSTMVHGALYFGPGSEPYVTIARGEPGPLGGVLMADVNLTFLRDVVSSIRIGESGRAYVVDDHGSLVAHPDVSLVLRQADLSELPQVHAATATLSGGTDSSMIGVDSSGQHVFSAFQPVRSMNWVVVTEQPLSEAFASVFLGLGRVVVVLLVALTGALLASVLVARRMVRPIQALQVGAARIGAGVLDQPLEIHTGDELEDLADEINSMTVRLRDSYQALERTTAERERHEEELRIARDIQQALLPRTVPETPGWAIRTHYQPARLVGGDLYDLVPLEDGQLGVVVGDVAGEGVPAALLMATTRTILRSVIGQGVRTPGEILERANELLFPDTPPNLFVTCLFAVVDVQTGHIRFANAGHVAPLRHRHAGGVDQLRARGMPLGLMPGSRYEEHTVELGIGETVLFYSDGVVEAHDQARNMFDADRLAAVAGSGPADGAQLIQRVLAELAAFTGPDWEQEDDLTLLTLERLAPLESEKENPACLRYPHLTLTSAQAAETPVLSTSAAR